MLTRADAAPFSVVLFKPLCMARVCAGAGNRPASRSAVTNAAAMVEAEAEAVGVRMVNNAMMVGLPGLLKQRNLVA